MDKNKCLLIGYTIFVPLRTVKSYSELILEWLVGKIKPYLNFDDSFQILISK